MRKFILFIFCALLFSSCMTTRTNVGNYQEQEKTGEKTYTYARGKQCYLFWGLLPLGRTNVATPPHGTCQVRTSYRFLDALVSGITGGIFAMQTITVKAVVAETKPANNGVQQNTNVSGQNQ